MRVRARRIPMTEHTYLAAGVDLDASQDVKARIKDNGVLSPRDFVRECLDGAGAMVVSDGTFENLAAHAETQGDIRFDRAYDATYSESRVAEMFQLIVATREYQLA